jgi:hypothetical protein
LKPYQGAIFNIDTLPGFRLEFRREPSGKVEQIVFHQPNVTFTALRSEAPTNDEAGGRA